MGSIVVSRTLQVIEMATPLTLSRVSFSSESHRAIQATKPRQEIEMSDLFVNARLTIAASELNISAVRSSGPGGQNVNKVNSKITLRWSPSKCKQFDLAWRLRFIARYSNRINRDGELVLHSDKYRDQPRNLADVRFRLVQMLMECREPAKARKKTRPTKGSQRRRKESKTQLSQKKQSRRQKFD